MKRFVSIVLCCLLALTAFAGCVSAPEADDGRLNVIATVYSEYDWALNIAQGTENADLELLLENGVDMHSFQPTADDIIRISSCDVFIYVGGESDKWVDDVLKQAVNKDMIVVNLMDVLGDAAKEEETVEGMQPGEEDEDEAAYDEHIWLSLRNAELCCRAIGKAFEDADAENAETYRKNTEAYVKKLDELDKTYADSLGKAKYDTLIFGDRFPFRYLTDDYNLKYYAAFAGCSADSEASFDTITFLADKLNELGLPAILTIEGSDGKIADSIIRTAHSDAEILTVNSMQRESAESGKTNGGYLGIMNSNLGVLLKALGA